VSFLPWKAAVNRGESAGKLLLVLSRHTQFCNATIVALQHLALPA